MIVSLKWQTTMNEESPEYLDYEAEQEFLKELALLSKKGGK